MERITVVLADDNLIVREGVRALLALDAAIDVVGVAGDYDELVAVCGRTRPQVLVTDIRMPPNFQDEGIEGAKEVRRLAPGTGVVVLSQYDSPEYAVELLAEGQAGYAYLLKDRVADSGRLVRAVKEVAAGGSMLDPEIVAAMVSPARPDGDLSAEQETMLREVASGRPVKAMAASRGVPPEAVNAEVEQLFLDLARGATAGREKALRRLRMLHEAITQREEQGETLSRLLPGGLAEKLRSDRGAAARTERLRVTVLMSDVRGYSGIAEKADPAVLAGQLNAHRREMNAAILAENGTVTQYVGDAVMAVFGAPSPVADHAARAVRAAAAMHERQRRLDVEWAAAGLAPFGLGIGLSTGEVAAALLGSSERLEYTLVGDTVNLAQRLQDLARPAGTTVAGRATLGCLDGWEALGLCPIKGREAPGRGLPPGRSARCPGPVMTLDDDAARASRRRLVTADDEFRRRTERRLHEGAQQHLVALAVKLGLAETLAAGGEPVVGLLQELRADVRSTVEELRSVALDVYPSLLRSRGLEAALDAAASRRDAPAPVVDLPGRLPPDQETAVYFAALAALPAQVTVRCEGARVVVEIEGSLPEGVRAWIEDRLAVANVNFCS